VASRVEDAEGRPAQTAKTFSDLQAELFADGFSFSGYERDMVALNRGDGRYLDISGVSGADSVSDGRGSVFADFDNDGDLDIFLRAVHGEAHHLFRNNVGAESGFVRVALRGTDSGRDAFGAEVRLGTTTGVLTKVKSGGSGFVSQSDPRLLFGLGEDAAAEWLEVTWPSGRRQRFEGPPSGSSILIVEGADAPVTVEERRFSLPAPLSPDERRWLALGLEHGRPVKDISIHLLSGGERRLSDLFSEGETLLLNLWATWCRPCAREMPELQKLHLSAGPHPRVVGVSVDGETTRDRIGQFVENLGITYEVAHIESSELQRLLGTTDPGVPVSLILDDQLRPIDLLVGWSDDTAERLEGLTASTSTQ
jgi:thiol-disulfide isomerase/thioredoxin